MRTLGVGVPVGVFVGVCVSVGVEVGVLVCVNVAVGVDVACHDTRQIELPPQAIVWSLASGHSAYQIPFGAKVPVTRYGPPGGEQGSPVGNCSASWAFPTNQGTKPSQNPESVKGGVGVAVAVGVDVATGVSIRIGVAVGV